MPVQSCDPTQRGQGEIHNQVRIESGPVLIDSLWDWDGVSVWRDCNGPLVSVRLRNTGSIIWYANLPGKKQGNKWFEIPPGTDQTFNSNQLHNAGLDTYTDLLGVGLSGTPGG